MSRSRSPLAWTLGCIAAATLASAASALADESISAAFAAKLDAAAAAALKAEIAGLQQQEARAAVAASEAPQRLPVVAAIPTPPPTAAAAADAADVSQLQTQLRRIGCYSGSDADWSSPEMRDGLARYARYANLGSPPAAPTAALLRELTLRAAGFCPPPCREGGTVVGGRCVAKTCAANQFRDASGACVAQAAPKPARAAAAPAKRPPTPHCFVFNGSPFCE